MRPCVYCGDVATTSDHVPPRCVEPFNTFTVPACHDCNVRILGPRVPYANVRDRQAYVAGKLRARLAKLPEVEWSPDEIEQLGPMLKQEVEILMARRAYLIERLAFAELASVASQEASGADEIDNSTADVVKPFKAA